MQEVELATTWEAPGIGDGPCCVRVERYARGDRWRRAARTGGVLLAIGALTVAIPVLHLFLPPIFLLLAIGLGAQRLRQTEAAVAAHGVSPASGREVTVELGRTTPRYPLWAICPDSGERLRIEAPAAG